MNLAVIAALAVVMFLLNRKFSRQMTSVVLVGAIALAGMGIVNVVKVINATQETKIQLQASGNEMPSFQLSKEGENVVVIMLDRAIGPYIPYIMEERPELTEQFDGFVHYANTLSYGACTNFAAPALYGGYEYTPVSLNLRDTELLEDKHNEALKVLPNLFSREGYDVTVIDPSYAGYKWIPDLSIYDDLPDVSTYIADGRFNNVEDSIAAIAARRRNFFFFSLMKTLPVSMQDLIYNNGQYRAVPVESSATDTSAVSGSFMNAYNVMINMSTMTNITTEKENTFMFMRSNFTHEAVLLQEPDFTPSSNVDNSQFYGEDGRSITAGDSTLTITRESSIAHYHANMAAMIQLGSWFDYLRENDVYDNTRIILVSDHGWELSVFDTDGNLHSTEHYRPLLLVKDFNATGFTQSMDFMTNADVPTLALEDLIQNPVNPYTGNPINSDAKADPQWVIVSSKWEVDINNGYQFLPAGWATVSDDVSVKENWKYQYEPTVFPNGLKQDTP